MTEARKEPPQEQDMEPGIRVHLEELLRRAGRKQVDVAQAIGIHSTNLSRLANGHVSFIRLKTLKALCAELDCQPGDLLTYE